MQINWPHKFVKEGQAVGRILTVYSNLEVDLMHCVVDLGIQQVKMRERERRTKKERAAGQRRETPAALNSPYGALPCHSFVWTKQRARSAAISFQTFDHALPRCCAP
jgi:hypothetical protein